MTGARAEDWSTMLLFVGEGGEAGLDGEVVDARGCPGWSGE